MVPGMSQDQRKEAVAATWAASLATATKPNSRRKQRGLTETFKYISECCQPLCSSSDELLYYTHQRRRARGGLSTKCWALL
jgi:hypothetical protein